MCLDLFTVFPDLNRMFSSIFREHSEQEISYTFSRTGKLYITFLQVNPTTCEQYLLPKHFTLKS